MARYDDLVASVAIHVSPCPEHAIMDAVKHTIRDFCEKSKIWVVDCDLVVLQADEDHIKLSIPDDVTVIHLWSMQGRHGKYQNNPDYYFTFPNLIKFNSSKMAGNYLPVVSLKPGLKSDEFPDFIHEYFNDALVSGAVAYLQMQPFREWSQPNAAGIHQEKYLLGIDQAIKLRDQGLNISKSICRVRPAYI